MNDFNIDTYLYSALENGYTIDDIVKKLTESVNNVNKVFQKEQEKKEREAKRLELAQKMADATTEYLKFMYPNFDFHELEGMSAKDYADAVDKSMDIVKGVGRGIEDMKRKTQLIKEHLAVDKDPLNKFLRENGLK